MLIDTLNVVLMWKRSQLAKLQEGQSWNKHSCVPKFKNCQSVWTLSSANWMYIEKKSRKLPRLCSLPGQQLNAQLLPASLEGMQERMGTAKGWDKGTVSEGREGRGNKFCKGNCHLPEAQPPIQVMGSWWNRVSLGQFWPAVPTVFSPSFLLIPGLVAGEGRVEGKMKPWCCASNVQQKPKHWCLTSTIATNPKQSSKRLLWRKLPQSLPEPVQ